MFLVVLKNKIILYKALSFLLLRHFFNCFLKQYSSIFLSYLDHRGLGFKFFIHKNFLYVLSGMSHYYKVAVPLSLFLIRRSKRLILFCRDLFLLKRFIQVILNLNNFFVYKEKGILSNVT